MDLLNLSIRQKFDLAMDPATSAEVLEKLAFDEVQGEPDSYDEAYALRRWVAGNPNSPTELLRRLADDEELEVRLEVAKNSSTPLDLILKFSGIEEFFFSVASNNSCPTELLDDFAKHRDEEIKQAVAANPNCSLVLIKKWAKVKNESIRASVASNPNTPLQILQILASDSEAVVRMEVAANLNCPTDLLASLAKDSDSDVRHRAAQSENCSSEMLLEFSNDPDVSVIQAVAMNHKTPIDVLMRLANHKNDLVRLALLDNPSSTNDVRNLAITIPSCSFPSNSELSSIMEPVFSLKDLIVDAGNSYPGHPFLTHPGIKDIDFCSAAWLLRLFRVPTEFADRTRGMLEGPFFTSSSYPWPQTGDGKYFSPVVQVDLREISKLKDRNYGDGLLQLFLDGADFLLRVIPREDICSKLITNVPSDLEDDYSGWITQKYWLGDGSFVSQIVGYDEPVLSANVYASDGIPDDDDPEIFKEIFSRMESLEMNDSGIHMFGTFYPIQYRHSDIGGELFMSLDSEICYEWGDSGNAQIFVSRDSSGSISFHAQWSCY